MSHHSDLIDTTEMYLKAVFELQEEGIVPLRARIAERLGQSGPTVSQTVARMERDGLLRVEADRHLEFTPEGRRYATSIMRKHRLAERLLVDVIGLDWELVHNEACRWEHVISEDVERRLVEILDHPAESPYGNPIPGLEEIGDHTAVEPFMSGVHPLDSLVSDGASLEVVVKRIGEPLQTEPESLAALEKAGAVPGDRVSVSCTGQTLKIAGKSGNAVAMSRADAAHIFVEPGSAGDPGA